MADSLAEMQQEPRFWQRLLLFGGYDLGKVDGILGGKSNAAAARWMQDAEAIKRELGTFDERSERNMATLLPKTQRAARLWLALAKPVAEAAGYDVKIICGTRTYKEQNALFAKRPRVTKAAAGQSFHNFGLAWDFGVFSKDGKKYYGDHALYLTLGKLASKVAGVTWGGSWTSFVDMPHIQLSDYASSTAARHAFEK